MDMLWEANPVIHTPSLLYALQPRVMDTEIGTRKKSEEEEMLIAAQAADCIEKFVATELLLPTEEGSNPGTLLVPSFMFSFLSFSFSSSFEMSIC